MVMDFIGSLFHQPSSAEEEKHPTSVEHQIMEKALSLIPGGQALVDVVKDPHKAIQDTLKGLIPEYDDSGMMQWAFQN
jgi:hypothetical protein